jgi:hypothetical protein
MFVEQSQELSEVARKLDFHNLTVGEAERIAGVPGAYALASKPFRLSYRIKAQRIARIDRCVTLIQISHSSYKNSSLDKRQ